MFCLAGFLFILYSLPFCQVLQLKSINNVTIPTIITIEKIDLLSYEKVEKNKSALIEIQFLLIDLINIDQEKIDKAELKINNVVTAVELVDFGKTPSRSSKIYIIKESKTNSSILFKLKFSKLDYVKPGEYEVCLSIKSDKVCGISIISSPPILAKFAKPKLGLEGDPIRITCLFETFPNETQITWSLVQGSNFTTANITEIIANEHIEIKAGKESNRTNDTLVISKLFKNDSGIYMCTVRSMLGKDVALVRVNVKDRWAALYPFIGIVIEVIILVVAILVYEKYQIRSQNRKSKEYDDNADEDNKEPGIPLSTGGGDEDNVGGENGGPTVEIEGEKVNSLEVRQREATTKNV